MDPLSHFGQPTHDHSHTSIVALRNHVFVSAHWCTYGLLGPGGHRLITEYISTIEFVDHVEKGDTTLWTHMDVYKSVHLVLANQVRMDRVYIFRVQPVVHISGS